MSENTKINYLFISFSLLLHPLNVIFGLSEIIGKLQIVSILTFLCFIMSMRDKNFRKTLVSGPMLIWGIWTLYTIINWYYIGYNPDKIKMHEFIIGKLRFYLLLVVIVYEANKNLQQTLNWILGTFLVYTFIGLTMQGSEMRTDATWEGRNGIVLGNHLPLTVVGMFFISLIMNVMGFLRKKHLIAVASLSIFVILWVATRKAMGAIFIMGIFYSLTKFNFHKPKNIAKMLTVAIFLYISYSLVMQYTLLGQRSQELNEMEFADEVPEYLFFVGDRAIQYVMGWELFLENPINGIGINNFMPLTGFIVPLHTEYMVQLCEGGLIGATLFIWYISKYFQGIWRYKKRVNEAVGIMMYGGLFALLFISLTSWIYNLPHFYAIYGTIAALCFMQQNASLKKTH